MLVPIVFWSVVAPVPYCGDCGAVAKRQKDWGPVIPVSAPRPPLTKWNNWNDP